MTIFSFQGELFTLQALKVTCIRMKCINTHNARDRDGERNLMETTIYYIMSMFCTSLRRSSLDLSSKTVIHDLWPTETGTKKESEKERVKQSQNVWTLGGWTVKMLQNQKSLWNTSHTTTIISRPSSDQMHQPTVHVGESLIDSYGKVNLNHTMLMSYWGFPKEQYKRGPKDSVKNLYQYSPTKSKLMTSFKACGCFTNWGVRLTARNKTSKNPMGSKRTESVFYCTLNYGT